MKKTISKIEDRGGEHTAMRTKKARRLRLVAKTSTAGDVKRNCNTRNRSREEDRFVALQTFAMRLAPWTNSILVDEI